MKDIQVDGVKKSFHSWKKGRVEALRGLSLEVNRGEVFGFLGPNGAGKSTTIKCLMGLIRPDCGRVRLMGRDVSDICSRMNVGYLPENPALFDYVSGEQYLDMVGRVRKIPNKKRVARIDAVLDRLSLDNARKRAIRGYSKGMVQRLGLAQALLSEPQVLVLDEPMSGLDPLGRALVKELLLELKENGHTVFFSTHITTDVEMLCDRVGILSHGEMKGVFEVDAVLSQGLKGYQVHYAGADDVLKMLMVDHAGVLVSELRRLEEAGKRVVLVDPVRKSLQDVFLDVVDST